MRMLGIFGTKISPPRIRSRQDSTNSTPWVSVIQKRVMRSSVIGRLSALLGDESRKNGTTLPREPTTLP